VTMFISDIMNVIVTIRKPF